jgi:MFS family permease
MELFLKQSQGLTFTEIFSDPKVIIIFCVAFLIPLGIMGIVPDIPRITQELNIKPTLVNLIISFYTLPGIIFCPFLGFLIDRFGKRTFLIPSLFFYGLFGLLCIWIDDFYILLMLRFLQGISVAFLVVLNITLISDIPRSERRRKVFGLNVSSISLGGIIWSLLGGMLADLNWKFPFYLFAVSLLASLILFYFYRFIEQTQTRPQPVQRYFKGIRMVFSNHSQLWLIMSTIFICYVVFFGAYLSYFPIYMDYSFQMTSMLIGMIMASTRFAALIVSSQLNKLIKIFSFRNLFNVFILLYIVSLLLIPFVSHYLIFFVPALICGCAHGIFLPMSHIYLTEKIPDQYRASIVSLGRVVNNSGMTFGPLLMSVVFGLAGVRAVFFVGALIWIIFILFKLVWEKKELF